VFDQRGFPIFDDIARSEVRISGDLGKMTPDAHKRAATRQLRANIENGVVNKKMFTDAQWLDIERGAADIDGFTWHHHQDPGRMQLVPRTIHKDTGHFGGGALWGMK
jgi:filamentous hemagglutinin